MLSIFVCFCILCSCNKRETEIAEVSGHRFTVAVKSDSDEALAADAYSSQKGMDVVRYNETSDAVVAVLNGKVDYVVLNEYEAQKFLDAGNTLDFVECTEYKVEYVAWFNTDNERLKDEFNNALKVLEEAGVLLKIKEANRKGESYVYSRNYPVNGELVMLCDPIFENVLYYTDDGEVRGTDYDIAKSVCAYLGYNLTVEVVDFDELFLSLEQGDGDFILSATQYTSERAGFFAASDVYSTLNYNVYKRLK